MKTRNLLTAFLLFAMAFSANAQETKENFGFGWKFIEQDVNGAEQASFTDKQWTSVDLPHDWDIYHAPGKSASMSNDGGYYPGGIGWYRKTFSAPQTSDIVRLHFEGVYQRCKVYLNGKLVGTHSYGYTPFSLDITDAIDKKGNNVIAVRVDNSQQPNCRWYSGSGIYRHVWLETYKKDAVDDLQKLFVRTEKLFGMSADGTHADSASVRISYEGKEDEVRTFKDVTLWSPENPKLYDIKVGTINVKYGFREVKYDAQNGFSLNGQKILINGACVHHDDGVIGAMAFDRAEMRKVQLMKKAGFNLIRTSHNLQTRAFLDACDSIGMMVIDEAFDGWYTKKTAHDYHEVIDSCYKEDISAMVRRDRNHACVVCWSIGNEVIERKEIRVIQTARKFKKAVLDLDSTRPVTEALCSWDKDWEIFDPHAEVLDIVGYNYMMHKAEGDHGRCPERVMWQTESYPRDAFKNWDRTSTHPYIIGDIVWTGLDYLGESGIGQFYYPGEPNGEHYIGKHFPFHGAYCGDVDMTGWRKPISHYRSMLWNGYTTIDGKQSSLYLAVKEPDGYTGKISETLWSVWPTWESWNWKGWEGKPVDVEVYTKAPAVSLYLDDKLIETKKVDRSTQYKAVFSVPYSPGTLRAVALDANGKENESQILSTSGEAYRLRLTPEQKSVKANGEDLAYVILEVVDKEGRIVPDASVEADINVSGAGRFLAVASASMKDLEPTTSTHVTTYKGRAVVVVRTTSKAGKISVSAHSSLPQSNASVSVSSVK